MFGSVRHQGVETNASMGDAIMIYLHQRLTKWGTIVVGFAWGVIVARLVNEMSVDNVTFQDVLVRTFSPSERSPNLLDLVCVGVIFLIPLAKWGVRRWYAVRNPQVAFARLIDDKRTPVLHGYNSICFEEVLTLQASPFITDGWPLTEVRITVTPNEYQLPAKLLPEYRSFLTANAKQPWARDDRIRLMLVKNPASLTDDSSLSLQVRKTKTSLAKLSGYLLSADRALKADQLRKAFFHRDIEFPHRLCLHVVVVTSDAKILISRRSQKVDDHFDEWSASLEEQLTLEDIAQHRSDERLRAWLRRALLEELGLDEEEEPTPYLYENARLLSVFVETDMMNVSLCGIVPLELSSADLMSRLEAGLAQDSSEHVEFAFLDMQQAFDETFGAGHHKFHATSRYRLLMYMLHKYGEARLTRMCVGHSRRP